MNRTLTTLALAAAATTVAAAPSALAADNGLAAAPSGVTTSAVSAADQSATGALGQAFTENVAKQAGHTLAKGVTKRTGAPVTVYMLSPQFVKSGAGPVGQFAYAATSYAINGQPATVYSMPTSSGWQGVNIATGTTEQALSSKASASTILLEPQVHAYYAVKGQTLQALNASAQKAIGGKTISLAKYAAQVHAKYASMLPGSSYDKKGEAGGFAQGPVASTRSSVNGLGVATSSVGAAAVLGAGAVVYRRRKKA